MFTLPLKTVRQDIVGVLQVINAHDESGNVGSFSRADLLLVRHFANTAAVALERAQLTRTLFLRMIGMAQLRHAKETGPHVNRVAAYARPGPRVSLPARLSEFAICCARRHYCMTLAR